MYIYFSSFSLSLSLSVFSLSPSLSVSLLHSLYLSLPFFLFLFLRKFIHIYLPLSLCFLLYPTLSSSFSLFINSSQSLLQTHCVSNWEPKELLIERFHSIESKVLLARQLFSKSSLFSLHREFIFCSSNDDDALYTIFFSLWMWLNGRHSVCCQPSSSNIWEVKRGREREREERVEGEGVRGRVILLKINGNYYAGSRWCWELANKIKVMYWMMLLKSSAIYLQSKSNNVKKL